MRWGVREVIRSWGQRLHESDWCPYEIDPEDSSLLPCLWSWALDLPTLRIMRNKCALFELPCLWYFCNGSQMDWNIQRWKWEGRKRSSHLPGRLSVEHMRRKFDLCSQLILVVFLKESVTPQSWKVSQAFKPNQSQYRHWNYKLKNISYLTRYIFSSIYKFWIRDRWRNVSFWRWRIKKTILTWVMFTVCC